MNLDSNEKFLLWKKISNENILKIFEKMVSYPSQSSSDFVEHIISYILGQYYNLELDITQKIVSLYLEKYKKFEIFIQY